METKNIILKLRMQKGLSQDELAEKIMVTRQAVSRWENGETVPNTETLKLLSKEFDVSINTLLGEPRKLICQCCGMPIEDDSILGRDKDGTLNEEYCKWCYADGTFTYSNLEELIAFLAGHLSNSHWPPEQVRAYFTELLPKFSVMYSFDETRNLYLTIAKGYKSGGFNTQIFSDVLQQKMMNEMGFGTVYDADKVVSYEPEYSWNYELGGHFSCMEGAVRGDFALFYIDCRDQQLTIFPEGTTTGRMMTNAGRTRSFGGELSLQVSPWQNLDINAAYGYTNAKFVRYNDGKTDYKGNYLPYAPQHTLSANGAWTIPTGVQWLGNIVLQAGVRCAGRIWWNEENSLSQPFYALVEASLRFEQKHYSVDIWGRNLADAGYNVFYFKSIGNEFVQRGRPRTFGITLNINL